MSSIRSASSERYAVLNSFILLCWSAMTMSLTKRSEWMYATRASGSRAYNPLFIYGGVGLGKTHLMQAVGHSIKARDPEARVAYIHSERFVSDMVIALQHNKMNEFKTAYRSLD